MQKTKHTRYHTTYNNIQVEMEAPYEEANAESFPVVYEVDFMISFPVVTHAYYFFLISTN